MNAIAELYQSRCKNGRPTFWKPKPISYHPICYYADTTKLADESGINMLQRIIGLGLHMEINVSRYVVKGITKDLPDAGPALPLLLRSNAADETRHEQGFKEANKTYGSIYNEELQDLVQAWNDEATKSSNPISVAGQLEVSVFLITLGLMRIVGSPGITELSFKIAEDENRHIVTNHAISTALGLWGNPNLNLIDSTIEWVFGEGLLDFPELKLENFIRYSRELLTDLRSTEFDDLTWYTSHHLPFELENDELYTEREYG